MSALNRLNEAPHTSLQLIAGIVLGGIGVAVLLRTGTSVGSLSLLGIGLSFLVGLGLGAADYIEPLQRALERGRWLVVGISVLSLLLIVLTESVTVSLLTSLTLGLASGVLFSTVSIAASHLTSQ